MHNMTNDEKLQSYRETNDIVFGNKWFEKHQSKLLFLLNNQLTKRWFRWCLRIRQCDIPLSTDIIEIAPNRFSWGTSEKKTTDFRTHDKFSKRLYSAFKPLWYLLHAIDWAMFDRYEELAKLSFGFSTLTAYPNSIGTFNPVCELLWRDTQGTQSAIKAGAGTGVNPDNDAMVFCRFTGAATTDEYSVLYRSIICFDTSSLTSSATISAAVLSLYGSGKSNDGGTPSICIYNATPASTSSYDQADFDKIGTTEQSDTITYANWSTTGYNAFTFNSTGRGNIAKTASSSFGVREKTFDAGASSLTWGNGYRTGFTGVGTYAGTSTSPKLVVTYSIPILPKTGYRIRAYATNSAGTSYGDTVQVTTADESNASLMLLLIKK